MFRAHVLIVRRTKLYYTASGIITPIGGCPVHRLRESSLNLKLDGHLQVWWYQMMMHKFLFYNKFIIFLYMFRALCAHHQEVIIVLYSIWYHHTCRWSSGAHAEGVLSQTVHRTATYRHDNTRCCIIYFWPPGDEQIVLETCRGI